MTLIQLPTDPTYWGQDATDSDVDRILDTLQWMIVNQFESDLTFERTQTPRGSGVHGDDLELCEQIHCWIQNNWTMAL